MQGAHGVFDITSLVGLPPGFEGGFTAKRMIGSVTIAPGASNLVSEGTYAVMVVPRGMISQTMPHPAVDLMDYYYHKNYSIRKEVGGESEEYPFDIHTSRRVRGEDRTLAFVLDAVVNTILWSASFRLVLQRG